MENIFLYFILCGFLSVQLNLPVIFRHVNKVHLRNLCVEIIHVKHIKKHNNE